MFFVFVCLHVYLNIFYFARWKPGGDVAEILTHCCHLNHLDGMTDFLTGKICWSSALNKVRAIRCVKNILIGCLHCVDSLDNCQPSPSLVLHRSGYRGQCLEKRSLGGEAAGLEITRKERRGKTQGEKCLWVAG